MAPVSQPVGQGFAAQDCLGRVGSERPVRTGVWRGGRVGLVVLHGCGYSVRSRHGCLCGIEVGFFLKLADILLVPDSFVAKPVGYLQSAETWVKGKRGQRGKKESNFQWSLLDTKGTPWETSILSLQSQPVDNASRFPGFAFAVCNLDAQKNTTSWN